MPNSNKFMSKLFKFLSYGCIALSGGVLLLSVVVNFTLHQLGYYINLSDSLPHGVYKAEYVQEPESMFSLNQSMLNRSSSAPNAVAPEDEDKTYNEVDLTSSGDTMDSSKVASKAAQHASQVSANASQKESKLKASAESAIAQATSPDLKQATPPTQSAFATSQGVETIALDSPVVVDPEFMPDDIDLDIARDQLVLVCLDSKWTEFATERGYIGTGKCPNHSAPVGKWIVAVPGDTVEFTKDGIVVNQELLINSQPSLKDGQGRKMPLLSGSHTLKSDEVVLCNPLLSSFDSRYFGPVHIQQIHATLSPVWLWSTQESIEIQH